MSAFDYANEKAWETSTETYLPAGNHVVTIRDPEMAESTSHNPMIRLRIENAQGSLPVKIPITPNTVSKVVQVFDAAKVQRPQPGEFDENTGKLTDACLRRLDGQTVGAVCREEPGFSDPTKKFVVCQGFVDASRITASASNGPAQTVGAGYAKADADIPF